MRLSFIFIFSIVFVGMSCTASKMNKMLVYHNAQLDQLAKKKMAPLKKMDVLADLMVLALEESLEFNKPKDSVKFLRTYTAQNKESIDKIYREIARWYNGLNATGKLVATAKIGLKPYVIQLVNLAPKVEKKINRKLKNIFFLSRFVRLLGL